MAKNLVKCHTCEKEVALSAEICPHCGVDNPGISGAGQWFMSIWHVLVWGVFIWICFRLFRDELYEIWWGFWR
ncbi:MAG: hypothetical protein MPK11_08940 [Gammaproteobacteria bacterium]|nr:hypothetical protein [Gammaproteobacteria bacterium]MDA7970875.1 hypothetical protein [Gammaproteobacteria bacterium]MDA7995583.1 hypothetical protein [Gammaproteobacteria bacterium]